MGPKTIAPFDWLIILIYITCLIVLSLYSSKKIKRQEDIFLAGRSMKRWPIALSMYMALFSTNSLLGVIGWLNQDGGTIWIGLQNIGIIMAVPLVIWLYPTLFFKLKINTAYEYLEKRFNYTIRGVAATLFLGARIMWLSTMLYAASLVISIMGGLTPEFGWENGHVWSIIAIGLIGASFGVAGGMRAVIWTDVVQFFVLMGCVVLMSSIAIFKVGGINNILYIANESAKFVPPKVFSLTDNLSIVSGLLLGFVAMLSSSGSDQVVLQTYLSANSDVEAKKSLWRNGFLIKPMSLIFPILGVIIFAYYQKFPDIATRMRVPDDALPVFVLNILPVGIRGLTVAAILSAILTSLNSGMTALSAVINIDYIQHWRKKPLSDFAAVILGRLFILLWGIILISCALWIRSLGTSNNIIQILNIVMYPFSGVLLGIFLLGLLTKRANGKGTLVGTVIGFLFTILVPLSKFIVLNILKIDLQYISPFVHKIISLSQISNFYYGALGVLMTILFGYLASFFFRSVPEKQLVGLVRIKLKHTEK